MAPRSGRWAKKHAPARVERRAQGRLASSSLSFCLRDWRKRPRFRLAPSAPDRRASPESHPRTVLVPGGTPESVTPSASGLTPCCFPARFLCSVHLSLIRYHSGQILSTPGEHLYICGGNPGAPPWKIGNCVGESLQFALFSPSGMWYTKMIVRGSAVFPDILDKSASVLRCIAI